MNIKLWFSEHAQEWRWALLVESKNGINFHESGNQKDLRAAMSDIANTVEYLMNKDI